MTETAISGGLTPVLRLVANNPTVVRPLMPIGALDQRLRRIRRRLERRDIDTATRDRLAQQSDLIQAMLAARPFEPARARRLEQELRWLTRAGDPGIDAGESLWERIDRLVHAMLRHDRPAPTRTGRSGIDRMRAA